MERVNEKLLKREREKRLKQIEKERNQKPVREITINIEWKKSKMWGLNPHCTAQVYYKDGTYTTSSTYKATGCGYDKESTVIADVLNDYLRYKLWNLQDAKADNLPYGIHLSSKPNDWSPRFEGGIGTGCYYRMNECIGGEFKHVASGKTFDVWKYTDNIICKVCGSSWVIPTAEGHWCKNCKTEL